MFSFISDVRSELAKVSWPTRNEVIRLTAVVITISILMGLYLGGLDLLFTKILEFIIK